MSKLFALILIVAIVSGCLVGCTNNTNATDSPTENITNDTQNTISTAPILNFLDSTKTKNWYFYNQLSDVEKTLYYYAYSHLNKFAVDVRFNEYELLGQKIEDESMMKVLAALEQDHPEYFWITNSFGFIRTRDEIILSFSRKDDSETLKEQFEECKFVGEEIISTIPENLSSYEKARYIYNCMLDMVEYTDEKGQYFDIRGTLLNKTTNCNGYAHTLKFLYDMVDIQSIVVYGATGDGWHAWNAIQLDDKWYWVDSTWGDSSNNRDYWFCMTDDEFFVDHTVHEKAAYAGWETTRSFVFPTCTDDTYREWWLLDLKQ